MEGVQKKGWVHWAGNEMEKGVKRNSNEKRLTPTTGREAKKNRTVTELGEG